VKTYHGASLSRNPLRPAEIVGIVEQVGTEHTLRLSNVGELNAIPITVTTSTEARRYGKNNHSRKGATATGRFDFPITR